MHLPYGRCMANYLEVIHKSCMLHMYLFQVFALVRYSDDPQKFSIEYSTGHVRRYAATER